MGIKIWDSVEMTDTKYVKKNGNLSAINGAYFYKRATEIFGSIGEGWGYGIISDELVDAAPMILNGENIGTGKIHTLKINFWYMSDDKKCQFEQYGHTRYMYLTNNGKVLVDEDYAKKSLTDAVKKALSNLGFCADVFLGMFEDNDYVAMVANKVEADKAEDRESARNENKKKLLEWVKKQCAVYEKIPTAQAAKLTLDKHIGQIQVKCNVLNESPAQLIGMVEKAHKDRVYILTGDKK